MDAGGRPEKIKQMDPDVMEGGGAASKRAEPVSEQHAPLRRPPSHWEEAEEEEEESVRDSGHQNDKNKVNVGGWSNMQT